MVSEIVDIALEQDTPVVLQEPPPVKFGTVASLCLGAVGASAAITLSSDANLTYFLNQVIGLDPLVVGAGITASLVLDSVIDPLIGQWSDRIRSPLGRRHPFMYAAAILAPLAYLFFWHIPNLPHTTAFLIYVFSCLAIARVTTSAFELANLSMVPELAPGYNQRTWFISFLTLTSMISLVGLGLVFNLVFVRRDAHHPLGLLNRAGYESFSVVCAVIICVTMLLSALGTQGRVKYFHYPPAHRVSFVAAFGQLSILFSDVSLVVVLISGLLTSTATGIMGGMTLYMYTYFWNLDPQQFAVITPMAAVGGLVAIIGAPILSTRLGKKPTMISTLSVGVFTLGIPIILKLLDLMPLDATLVVIILAADVAVGTALALVGVIVRGSMISDVVEELAVKTGQRAEALLFALQGLTPKIATGLGVMICGALLRWVRFPTHAVKGAVPTALMHHLVLLYLPFTGLLFLLALVALSFYRIDQSAHELNLARLREAGLAAPEKDAVGRARGEIANEHEERA